MAVTKQCPQCGRELPPTALEGNCPACLVRLALEADFPDVAETPLSEDAGPSSGLDAEGQKSKVSQNNVQLQEGGRIGKYTILKKLGEGGVGEVWLGYDPSLERPVAIKILKAQFRPGDKLAARFVQEARLVAQLNHPNIITVYDVDQQAGRFFIAMEHLPRGSVQDELDQRGRLDWREATLIIRDAVCGLEAAHQAKIVHRDIKPGNLLRTENGLTKVADFGLARLEASTSNVTDPGGFIGTPGFTAPEQIRPGPVDTRADLYSLACAYYALLTGHAPFCLPGESAPRDVVLYRHVHEPFPDAQQEVPDLPEGVVAILARGSQKDPANRYQHAWEFYQDLEKVLASPEQLLSRSNGQPQSTGEAEKTAQSPEKPSAASLLLPRRPRNRPIALLGAAGLVILAVFVVALWKPFTLERFSPAVLGSKKATLAEPSVESPPIDEKPQQRFTNTLGMVFVSVPRTKVLFCIWETRRKDFEQFVRDTGYDAKSDTAPQAEYGGKPPPGSWEEPGFPQTPEHPVCYVNWYDARAFCHWLTERERTQGLLGPDQGYRLPSDLEWSAAVGLPLERGVTPLERVNTGYASFPWGNEWPPPPGAGNYAGAEMKTVKELSASKTIENYKDEYPWTAPVGSFKSNRWGIYDLGGNVWEWCEDLIHPSTNRYVFRGGAWTYDPPSALKSSNRGGADPRHRARYKGFRCVLTNGFAHQAHLDSKAGQAAEKLTIRRTPDETHPASLAPLRLRSIACASAAFNSSERKWATPWTAKRKWSGNCKLCWLS